LARSVQSCPTRRTRRNDALVGAIPDRDFMAKAGTKPERIDAAANRRAIAPMSSRIARRDSNVVNKL
jgi:hypothetical protein